ncbi:Calbindin-32 [Frankliniella fusca]|uniref:Calbindin-32 n=1 Tax=Frankliniella fusca TaxID=407009 RepID=A0AAE1LSC3_9NEOP|nr:Calbindin-32 [Frankliniella fusca]
MTIPQNLLRKKFSKVGLKDKNPATAVAMSAAASEAAIKKLNLEKATNFMRQYRDPQSRELRKLSAHQFMEVWSHYDKDGE